MARLGLLTGIVGGHELHVLVNSESIKLMVSEPELALKSPAIIIGIGEDFECSIIRFTCKILLLDSFL